MVTLLLLFSFVSSLTAQGTTAPPRRVVARAVSPYYGAAADDALPVGYVNEGDSCVVESLMVTEGGTPWFALRLDTVRVWSPTSHWRYAREITEEVSGTRDREEEDRKRRLMILREHRDWPRRVIRAVREGRVCLDMTAEQLEASWGAPVQRSPGFTLGIGRHESWLYEGSEGEMLVVNLQDGRVIGWSLE
jgi:hypothetical protein